jgi:transposase
MTPEEFIEFNTIPETRVYEIRATKGFPITFFLEKTSEMEVCPRCAYKCYSGYDRRLVTIKDAPFRNGRVLLVVRKRRFWCPRCEKPFTEPLQGVGKGKRVTERLRKNLCVAAEKYAALEDVRKDFGCSDWMVYSTFYEQLKRLKKQWTYPLPRAIGIDEHSFRRDKRTHEMAWNTIVVDHVGERVYDLIEGRRTEEILPTLKAMPGREGVEFVTIDLSEGYRSAVKEAFPQAQIVADRFHVLRCIDDRMKEELRRLPADIRKRDKAKERLLFRKLSALSSRSQESLTTWLLAYPALAQLHSAKQEMLRALGRKGSPLKRRDVFSSLMDKMAKSTHATVRSLRQTYFSWRNEIANAILTKWSNGRTEGFNCKAKLVKREGYGFRNWENFRLKFWYSCFGQYV